MKRRLLVLALGLVVLPGCKEITGLFEPSWEPVDTNGEDGALHFGMNPFDMRVGLPEHVRIERNEKRTITKPGGAKEEQERQRQVQVVLARCDPRSICEAQPHSADSREVVVTPSMFGDATLYVTVAVDGQETMKDKIRIHVVGR